MLKMLKTIQIYQECIFLGFHCCFYFFVFFKYYQNIGSKIGQQQMLPLYNAYEAIPTQYFA
jgi:hypothetical protein